MEARPCEGDLSWRARRCSTRGAARPSHRLSKIMGGRPSVSSGSQIAALGTMFQEWKPSLRWSSTMMIAWWRAASMHSASSRSSVAGASWINDGRSRNHTRAPRSPEQVPPLQNKIVACARQFGKPVVVATQMLE